MNLPYRLSAEQQAWFKVFQKNDCHKIAETAKAVYAEHFPYAERNEHKQQLHIKEMTFHTGMDTPATGDDSNILIWLLLGLASACGLTGTVLFKKKKSSVK